MKKLLLLLIALRATCLFAAEAVPLFNGTLTIGREHRFILVSPAGKASGFLRLGDVFEGYTIKEYLPEANALDLTRDGQVTRITLVGDAAIANLPVATPATLADAEAVFSAMRFDQLMASTAAGQKKAMEPVIKQSLNQTLARLNLPLNDEEKAAFAKVQTEAMTEALNVISGPEMREAMAKIYTESFSKQELEAMTAFYGTPAGQALTDKQPEVQQKMMGVMMPLVMSSQQAAQKKIGAHVAELRTKYGVKAPTAPNASAPAPSPAPVAPKQ